MKSARCVKAAVLLLVLTVFVGCDSKGDKPGANAVPPKEQPGASAPVVTDTAPPEKDRTDARAEGTRVIAQMKAGQFQAIYQEASPAFRELGTEPQFVGMMEQTRKKTGALKGSKETGLETGSDKRQMLTYSVEYDNVRSNLRLSFLRSKEGKMELVGLNQKDDLVKNAKKAKK